MECIDREAFSAYKREVEKSGVEVEQQYSTTSSTSNNTSTTNTTTVVGFDGIFVQLLDKLTGVPSRLQVLSIVGMGGVGKTTLVTNAFRHPLIVQHFDVCLWATISQQCNIVKILKQLLSNDEYSSGTVDELGERLYKSLCGRRYMIILDDMWSVEAWDEIKFFFPNTRNGRRIVATTRQFDVASHKGFSWLLISCLDADNSWDLFCRKAFEAEQECPSELEEIGRKIVEKCKGLPLAIVVVGGHFRNSPMTREYWENVDYRINLMLDSTVDDEHCLKVLRSSYSYLPVHLKPCFLSLGAFQEDEKIYVGDVVKLWIGEGLVESFENTSLEEVARSYVRDLLLRNLISIGKVDHNADVFTFGLHDLIRELCIRISQEEEFLHVRDNPRAIDKEHRDLISAKFPEMNHETKFLRAVNKIDALTTSDESIFQQVSLRYLNADIYCKNRPSLYLPSSISMLWNLQILKITVPDQSTVIAPYAIWEMLQLRQVEITSISLLDPLPVERLDNETNDSVLRNLHTLWDIENFRLSEEVCRRIPNIRTLWLSYRDEASSYYCPQNLVSLHELEHLVLTFDTKSKWRDFTISLTFPTSLQRLYLNGSRIEWETLTTTVGSLPQLVKLQLYQNSVIGSVWTTVEGKFLRLKYLEIIGCHDLVYWNTDNSHFPVLKELYLKQVSKLDEFPPSIGEIPTLEWISMIFCSISSTISAMRTLVEQVEEHGNEYLQLEVSFRGDEKTLEFFKNQLREEGLTSNNLYLHLQHLKSRSS